jgi:glycerol kinase
VPPRTVEQAFDPTAQVAGHHRAAAAGNGHLHRAAFHHRRYLHAGQPGIVHHVGEDVPLRRRCGGSAVEFDVIGGGHQQPSLVQQFRAEVAGDVVERPASHQSASSGTSARAQMRTRACACSSASTLRRATMPPPSTSTGRSRRSANRGNRAAVMTKGGDGEST